MSLLQPIKKLQYSAHQICLLSPLSICDSFKHGSYFPSPCTCASVIHTGVSFIFRKVNQVTNLVSEVKGEQKLCCCCVSSVLLHQSQNRNSGWFLSPQDFTVELLGENPTTGWQTAHPLGFGNRTFPLKNGLLFFISRDDSVHKGLVSVKILWLLNLMSKMMWKSASDENRTSGKWLRDVEECWPEYLET